MATLEERVVGLERAARRWRYAAVVLGMLLAVGVTVAAKTSEKVPDVMRVRRLEVVRPDGTAAIELSAEDRQARFYLHGSPDSELGMAFGAHEEGVSLMVLKHKEVPLFFVQADENGAMLYLSDGRETSQGPNRIALGSVHNDQNPHGLATLSFFRGSGLKPPKEAGLHLEGSSQGTFLLLGGPEGKRAKVRVEQETGKVEFLDEKNKLIWSTP